MRSRARVRRPGNASLIFELSVELSDRGCSPPEKYPIRSLQTRDYTTIIINASAERIYGVGQTVYPSKKVEINCRKLTTRLKKIKHNAGFGELGVLGIYETGGEKGGRGGEVQLRS